MKTFLIQAIVITVAVACSPATKRQNTQAPPAPAPDIAEPETDTAINLIGDAADIEVKDGAPVLTLFLGDTGVFTDTVYNLDAIVPTSGAQQRITIQIANFGEGLLNVDRVVLADTNGDGQPKNAWTSLQTSDIDLNSDLPVSLVPHTLDITSVLTFEFVYRPQQFDGNHSTLVIESNDPEQPIRKVLFKTPPLEPKIVVKPGDGFFWFATPLEPEELEFEIHNEGVAPLLVSSIGLLTESPLLTLVESSAKGGSVQPKGQFGYTPLKFAIRYSPLFNEGGGKAIVRIESSDPGGALEIPIEGKYKVKPGASPCVWAADSGDLQLLDFSDVFEGSGSQILRLVNIGAPSCTLTDIQFTLDKEKTHYSWSALIPPPKDEEGAEPTVVGGLPVSIAQGKELELKIEYTAGEIALNTPVVISYSDGENKTLGLQAKGGGPVPCLEVAPGPVDAPEIVQFVAEPGLGGKRSVVLYNCGTGPLKIQNVVITDELSGDEDSQVWFVSKPSAGEYVIPVGGLQIYEFIMAAQDTVGSITGTAKLTWLDSKGPKVLSLGLEALIDTGYTLPEAVPGTAEDYAGLKVGDTLTLDGSGSQSAGDPIAKQGYLWTLAGRPPASKLTTTGIPGGATLEVVPDVAGNYVFSLVVKTEGVVPLYSPAKTVLVVVADVGEE